MAKEISAGVPDVLETLAQLPNDEVFTPPYFVNEMLDLLPTEVWSNPTFRWLDPGAKSGSYLREASKRLMVGLEDWEPDPVSRRNHILKNMLFGASITELTAEISRRSLYQTADATGQSVKDDSIKDFVVSFDHPEGNVLFVPTEHQIVKGKCVICRAPEKLVRDRRENFAYSFIHGTYPTKEMEDMKFDVIVGNPPYQIGMDDNQGNRTANITPLYNMFVDKAISMNPRYILMITPSRWFAGGHSLSDYRERMLNDRRLKNIVDIPNASEVFPGVEVKGGVSYFLWDSHYEGDCVFSTRIAGEINSTVKRDLREGQGVLIRDNFAAEIVKKISSDPFEKGSLAEKVSASDPFGQSIKTNFKGAEAEPFEGSIPLVYVNKVGYIKRDQLERNHDWVDKWKVLLPKASDGRGGVDQLTVLGEPIVLAPGSACTQSYLVAGTFESANEAENYGKYLTTKFVRFLVLQRKVSQDLTPVRFKFVPLLDMNKVWTDDALYALFALQPHEVEYIEKAIAPRDWIDSLDSPIPATHLPGGRKYKAADVVEEADFEDEDE
ncbi:Eco57I restriction-modification methylase domain-containing protein [Aurantimicrobium minutum]|uniref:Eco57I restriction-modification methylase domain-containing protein n=1 Tax=Aurantimicrobium minutum TaxID=708131 RepID=UPI002474B63E|nr:Eco57I restriction-modification methylase domain-containing protein [Aurantimicrobium minutum]MDH6536538.1 site-specific DNA-methyltransferase (adenine-specific) [Aurantimicrobium minutum]